MSQLTMNDPDKETLLKLCREKEFHAYGTSRIFERRAERYGNGRTWITYFGIVIPLLVGATAMAFGADSSLFPGLLYFAGFLAIIQLAISVWSVVARWDERHGQALESSRANTRLYNLWKKLGEHPTSQLSERVEEARSIDHDQEQRDLASGITDKEKRFAMHEALFYFRKPCPTCKVIPQSKKPSECDMCGNY